MCVYVFVYACVRVCMRVRREGGHVYSPVICVCAVFA